MSKEITLKLTEEQAQVINNACEMYSRIWMGQFDEITFRLMMPQPLDGEWLYRREAAEKLLYVARDFIYPELGYKGHSYGVGKFKNADIAFNVHQVLRNVLGDERKPFDVTDAGMPECEVKEVE